MGNENDIQKEIINSIEEYFKRKDFNVQTHIPTSAAQTDDITNTTKRPYDFSIFVDETLIIFLEVKELEKLNNKGKFPQFNKKQKQALIELQDQGLTIPYVYNTWDFTRPLNNNLECLLNQTHIRKAEDFFAEISLTPVEPAKTLQEFLKSLEDESDKTNYKIAEFLAQDLNLFKHIGAGTLVILANLDENKVFIHQSPKKYLKMIQNLFKLPAEERKSYLEKIKAKTNFSDELESLAIQIFSIRDSIKSKKLKI